MDPANPALGLCRSNAPQVPDDWYFLLLENLTSSSRLVRVSHQADCLSVGSFLGRGAKGRQSLPGYGPGCEAELGKVVRDLLRDEDAVACPLFLYWISPPEVIQDARLRTVLRRCGCRSLGEFIEKGTSWRLNLPGYGSRAEEELQRHVAKLIGSTPPATLRRVGELTCLLRHDAASLCQRLLAGQGLPGSFPQGLLRVRLLEEVDLLRFLRIFKADFRMGPREAYFKQDLLEGYPVEEQESLELELYIRAGELLSIRQWTPEICDRFVPAWVLNRMLVASTTSPKLVRRAERYGWRCYADLLHDLRRVALADFGDQMEILLWEEVDRLARLGPVWDRSTSVLSRPQDLLDALQASIERLSPRTALILSERMGLGRSEPQTLQQLGHRLEVTRERIRQIERDAWKQIRLKDEWSSDFAVQLDQLLEEHCGIVPVSLLRGDSWLRDAASQEAVLNTMSQRLLTPPAYLYPSRGQSYLLELRPTRFDRLRQAIHRHIAKQKFPVALQELIAAFAEKNPFPDPRPGFTGRFAKVFGPTLEIQGSQVLGRRDSLPGMIKQILYQEGQPLHFEDIHYRLDQRIQQSGLADPVTIHQVRYHLVSDPKILLCGPGLYGLEEHFPDLDGLASQCLPPALQLMRADSQGRWSANDLWRRLKSHLDVPAWFNRYHLGIVLRRSPHVTYHGRLFFSAKK